MLTRGLRALVLSLMALLLPRSALAFNPPAIEGHVTDTAGKLTIAEDAELEAELAAVEAETGNEIAVLLCGSLEGETIEDVAYATFNAWKLGKQGVDNGVLLVIAPNERRVRIETGKGVGGALTDLQSSEIIRTEIGPRLKQDLFKEAIAAGTGAIAKALQGGGVASQPRSQDEANVLVVAATFGFILLVFAFVFVVNRRRHARDGETGGFWSSVDFTSGSGESSFSSSSSSSSGFSGGGGSSGGGGASGSY